jgi:hypothetical protein
MIMLHKKVNKEYGTIQEANAGKETTSKYYDRREDPIGSI